VPSSDDICFSLWTPPTEILDLQHDCRVGGRSAHHMYLCMNWHESITNYVCTIIAAFLMRTFVKPTKVRW
jgi:hypothetical protein